MWAQSAIGPFQASYTSEVVSMNCGACGHDWFDHDVRYDDEETSLCVVCLYEPHGGPCFPWEFRS